MDLQPAADPYNVVCKSNPQHSSSSSSEILFNIPGGTRRKGTGVRNANDILVSDLFLLFTCVFGNCLFEQYGFTY